MNDWQAGHFEDAPHGDRVVYCSDPNCQICKDIKAQHEFIKAQNAPQTAKRDEREYMQQAIDGLVKTNQRLVRINEELRATVKQLSYLLADTRLNERD